LNAELALHGEKLGGVWSAISKKRKPRDYICQLKIPDTIPQKYTCSSKNMANVAMKYQDKIQNANLSEDQNDSQESVGLIMEDIPRNQTLDKPNASALHHHITEAQTKWALDLSKSGSATRINGCPYELWKALDKHYKVLTKTQMRGFNIIQAITEVLSDIQAHRVDSQTNFALGWICPIYEKKNPTDISNY
jgi:hypothetical protein